MPPITDPMLLEEIKRQQAQGIGAPPVPPPADPMRMPAPQPFPGATPMRSPSRLPIGVNPHQVSAEHRQDILLPSQVGNNETELELKKLKLREERTKAGLDPETGKPLANSGLVGNDALSDLSEGEKDIVKGITQGRVPISSLAIGRNPQLYKLVQKAFQYEPGTDLTTFARRQAAFQKFMSNPNSPMVRVNQALQHLDRFATNAHELGNAHEGFFTNPLNVRNYASAAYKAVGKDAKYTAFATDRDALATELAAAFQGSGQSALEDRKHWQGILSAANSPESFDTVIKEAVGLLGGRVEASNSQFKQAVGANADFYDLMSPAARKVYEKFAPDVPADPDKKEISTTTKTVDIPEGYQHDHAGMLAHHTPGTLTTGQYIQIRQMLDEKYAEELGVNSKSHLDPKEVQDFVDSYNHGSKKIKIPALNVPLSKVEKSNAELAASPLGTGAAKFANAATFGAVDAAVGQEGRDKLRLMEEQNPGSAIAGEVLGSLAPMAGIEKGGIKLLEKIAPNLSVTARKKLLGDLAVNMTYGADRGFMGADDGEGIEGAGKGAVQGAVGTGVGTAITQGVKPLISEASSRALKALEGVDTTTLQKLGLGKAEKVLTGLPFTHGARRNAEISFNINNSNRVLQRVGETLPKNVEPGLEMNDYVNKVLNGKYNEIRPQIVGSADGTFENAYTAIRTTAVTSPEKKKMFSEINDAVKNFFDTETGHYDGQGYKEASERLRLLAKTWIKKEGDVPAKDMAHTADKVRSQLQQLVQRQTPEVGSRLKNLERAWKHQSQIEDATNVALKTNEGIYSAGNLVGVQRAGETNKRMAARGKAFDQSYASAGQKVMGAQKVGDVNLGKTFYTTGLAAGAGIGAHAIAAPVAPIAAGAAVLAYMPLVKKATQAVLLKRPSIADKAIIERAVKGEFGPGLQKVGEAVKNGATEKTIRRMLEDATRHKVTGN